jgi:hypothetical protein
MCASIRQPSSENKLVTGPNKTPHAIMRSRFAAAAADPKGPASDTSRLLRMAHLDSAHPMKSHAGERALAAAPGLGVGGDAAAQAELLGASPPLFQLLTRRVLKTGCALGTVTSPSSPLLAALLTAVTFAQVAQRQGGDLGGEMMGCPFA